MRQEHTLIGSLSTLFFLLVLMLAPNKSSGESNSSHLNISVRVPPYLEYKIIKEQFCLIIRPDDIKKGYAEINSGSIFAVITNNHDGYILWMSCEESEFISHVLIMTKNKKSYELYPGENLETQMPYRGHHHEIVKLRFRIYLNANAETGVYVWPIATSIYPL